MDSKQHIDIDLDKQLEYYTNKIALNGSWASRSFSDFVFNLYFTNRLNKLNIKRINDVGNTIFQYSSGLSSIEQFNKINNIPLINIASIPSDTLSTKVYQPISIKNYIDNIPYNATSDFWYNELTLLLNCPAKQINKKLKEIFTNEQNINVDIVNLLYTYSFPLITKINNLNIKENINQDIRVIIANKFGSLTWKRWFLDKDKIFILDGKDRLGLSTSYWFVWKIIHDASHLYHLLYYKKPTHCTDIDWLHTSEAFAMNNEFQFLQILKNDNILPKEFQPFYYNIKVVLTLGLLERALRLDYDIDVHYKKITVQEFINLKKKKFNVDLFRFTKEFHGLPGFGVIYALGRFYFNKYTNKDNVLNGKEKLLFKDIKWT
jgi:hypothetical protein